MNPTRSAGPRSAWRPTGIASFPGQREEEKRGHHQFGTTEGGGSLMDPRRFEEFTRRISRAANRRSALTALVVALAAPVLRWQGENAAAGIPIVNCKVPGKRCDSDKKCCTGNCRKNICTCQKKGQAC